MEIFLCCFLISSARAWKYSSVQRCQGYYVTVYISTSATHDFHSTKSQMNIAFIGESGKTNKFKVNDNGWELRLGDMDRFNIPVSAEQIHFIGKLMAIEISTYDENSDGWRGAYVDVEIPYSTADACYMVKALFGRWTEDRVIKFNEPMILYPTDMFILDKIKPDVELPMDRFDELIDDQQRNTETVNIEISTKTNVWFENISSKKMTAYEADRFCYSYGHGSLPFFQNEAEFLEFVNSETGQKYELQWLGIDWPENQLIRNQCVYIYLSDDFEEKRTMNDLTLDSEDCVNVNHFTCRFEGCYDACLGKQNCTTFVDNCGINPSAGQLTGRVENPSTYFRVSFDIKCSPLSYDDVPKNIDLLNVFELSTMEPGETLIAGKQTSVLSIYAYRDNPLKIKIIGASQDSGPIFCSDDMWDGFTYEIQHVADNFSIESLTRNSDNMKIFNETILYSDTRKLTQSRFNAYVSHELDWAAKNYIVKNFVFENL